MHIEIIREVDVETCVCLDDEYGCADELTTWTFQPGDILDVKPDDEDFTSSTSTGFLFWEGGYGLIPNDAFRPVPAIVESAKVMELLSRLEKLSAASLQKESYTVKEVAERLGKSWYTVRQWCNLGRAHATKIHGRGRQGEWRIPHQELVRLQNDGPLPVSRKAS
jgi:hypothetical protein